MVAETSGCWGPTAEATLSTLAKVSAQKTGREKSVVLGEYYETLCVAIRRANARAVLRRLDAGTGRSEALVAAQEVLEAAAAMEMNE